MAINFRGRASVKYFMQTQVLRFYKARFPLKRLNKSWGISYFLEREYLLPEMDGITL